MRTVDIREVSPGSPGRCKGFLEFTGELHEARRQADILVQGITLVIAGDDLRAPFVRHGGTNFVEAGVQQIGNDGFDGLSRKQFRQGMQSRGIIELQAHRVLLRGPHRHCFFLPSLEQGLEFHVYSAIPDYRDMRIIDRRVGCAPAPGIIPRQGIQMNEAISSEERGWAMAAHLCGLLWILGSGGLFFLPFGSLALFTILGPLIILLAKGGSMPFAASQAKESLNFQITLWLLGLIFAVLAIVLVGFLFLWILGINLVLVVIAAIRVSDGVPYRYPFCLRLVK